MDEDNVRNSFIFYRSFLDVVYLMPKKSQGRMLKAIIELGLNDTIDETLPLFMLTALRQMKATIDGTEKRHEAQVKNGKKGGAPKGNQNARKKNNPNNLKVDSENNPNNLKDNKNRKGNAKANTFTIRKGYTSSDLASPDGGQSSDDDGWMSGKELRENGII